MSGDSAVRDSELWCCCYFLPARAKSDVREFIERGIFSKDGAPALSGLFEVRQWMERARSM